MEFDNTCEFSDDERQSIRDSHYWMEKYYGVLMNAKVNNISLAVDDENPKLAFLRLQFQLSDGELVTTELVSTDDINRPGILLGLPRPIDRLENSPNNMN